MEIVGILKQELARAQRNHSSVGIIFADIDHFKSINDSMGHLAGDSVLKVVSRRFTSAVRIYDQVGRYGGEEFLAVLPDCDLESTRTRAEELLRMVRGEPVETSRGKRVVTVSIGIASTSEDGFVEVEELLSRADQALYRAKEKGRNRVEGPMCKALAEMAHADFSD
jgi:diguanylate cyclase (GGDEF)-like protein